MTVLRSQEEPALSTAGQAMRWLKPGRRSTRFYLSINMLMIAAHWPPSFRCPVFHGRSCAMLRQPKRETNDAEPTAGDRQPAVSSPGGASDRPVREGAIAHDRSRPGAV